MKELVSVIIPFYRNANWLYEALDSVVNQTYENIEIVLVNDGSKESVNLERYKAFRIKYIFQNNKGAAAARNVGMRNSKGVYIAFLDSDDVWEKTKIEKQVNFLNNNLDYDWVHCSYKTFGSKKTKVINSSIENGMIYPNCLKTTKIGTPCLMIRRSVIVNSNYNFN